MSSLISQVGDLRNELEDLSRRISAARDHINDIWGEYADDGRVEEDLLAEILLFIPVAVAARLALPAAIDILEGLGLAAGGLESEEGAPAGEPDEPAPVESPPDERPDLGSPGTARNPDGTKKDPFDQLDQIERAKGRKGIESTEKSRQQSKKRLREIERDPYFDDDD